MCFLLDINLIRFSTQDFQSLRRIRGKKKGNFIGNVGKGGEGKGRAKESQADSALSTEPDVELDLTTLGT